ncbi:MAG TPA: 7-carboxy-7-deazaguanine synthase QueE [Candidatus Didemnitutus sp.]|nr:7-carboxy-7-deazaguanine synthase QueE [Candidatus Didemnitutus sp.]
MLISEIFHSLQGEGTLAGVPSVFVRTSGCNLRCNWCDTPYASWNPEGDQRGVDEIVAEVGRHPARHLVLTGGEPMIAPGIRDLAAQLRTLGYHITIETAATVAPDGIACDLASLSPKLANSAPDSRLDETWRQKHERLRWQPEVVQAWMEKYDYQLKFVVAQPGDLTEIESMLAQIGREIPRAKVLLMPEGTSVATLRERTAWLADLCRDRGYRYAPRLHIELYGNKRGT